VKSSHTGSDSRCLSYSKYPDRLRPTKTPMQWVPRLFPADNAAG